jgi:hypothetical protein
MVMTNLSEPTRAKPGRASMLVRPGPLSPGRRRRHALALGALLAFGLARGVVWAALTPVFSPIDEIAHFGYVESLAQGHGIPTIGRNLIGSDILRAAKASPTSVFRGQPFRATNTDPDWGPTRQQYEGTSGPLYYGLMVVPYWLGHPFGVWGSVLAVRLATVLLALVTVPMTWALARRLFPRQPRVWLVAPALVVATDSMLFGWVTNDSLSVVLGLASILALLRALDDQPARGWVAGAGALLGLAVVGKTTTAVVAPVLLVVAVVWWRQARPPAARLARTAATYAGAAFIVYVPWLAWNLVQYHSPSSWAAEDKAIGYTMGRPITLANLARDLGDVRLGLMASQLLRAAGYDAFWLVLLIVLAVAAAIVSWRRRAWDDLTGIVLAAFALPAGLVVEEVMNLTFTQGTLQPAGRHMLVLVPVALTGLAGALGVLATRRWVLVAAGVVVTVALALEVRAGADLVDRAYLASSYQSGLAPVVDQGWSDRTIVVPAVEVHPTCPVEGFWLGFAGPPPPQLDVGVGDQVQPVDATAASTDQPLYGSPSADTAWYRLPQALAEPFDIELPAGVSLQASDTDRTPALALPGSDGDPVARLYCREPSARSTAFRPAYAPNHPSGLDLDRLRALAAVELALAAAATAVAAVVAARGGRPSADRP